MESLFFLLLAATSVFAALMVILQKNPLSAVLFLVLVFFCLAALFVLLAAPFIAAIQLIIYAGAIMVLFLFVIMLFQRSSRELGPMPQCSPAMLLVIILILAVAVYLYLGQNHLSGPIIIFALLPLYLMLQFLIKYLEEKGSWYYRTPQTDHDIWDDNAP